MIVPDVNLKKPKIRAVSRTKTISALEVDSFADFPADKERSISAMIRGKNLGGIKTTFPTRKFNVSLAESAGFKVTRVTRTA